MKNGDIDLGNMTFFLNLKIHSKSYNNTILNLDLVTWQESV